MIPDACIVSHNGPDITSNNTTTMVNRTKITVCKGMSCNQIRKICSVKVKSGIAINKYRKIENFENSIINF